MEAAFYLLLLIGHLGVFDVIYFHNFKCRLHEQEYARSEVRVHTLRHLIYALQFFYVANFKFTGKAIFFLCFLLLMDIMIAFWDLWIEDNVRKSLGKLPKGEYFMHVVLSLLVGSYLTFLGQELYANYFQPTQFLFEPPNVPVLFVYYMNLMGMGAILAFSYDALRYLRGGSVK